MIRKAMLWLVFLCLVLACVVVASQIEDQQAELECYLVATQQDTVGPGLIEFERAEGGKIIVETANALSTTVASAHMAIDQNGQPAVTYQLNQGAAQRFLTLTENNIGRKMAFVVDGVGFWDGTIQSRIGSSGQLTGPGVDKLGQEVVASLNPHPWPWWQFWKRRPSLSDRM